MYTLDTGSRVTAWHLYRNIKTDHDFPLKLEFEMIITGIECTPTMCWKKITYIEQGQILSIVLKPNPWHALVHYNLISGNKVTYYIIDIECVTVDH